MNLVDPRQKLALLASRLAGHYVYAHGLDANEVDFFGFLQEFRKQT